MPTGFAVYDPRPRDWDRSKSIKARFDLRRYRDRHPQLLQDLHKLRRPTLKDASLVYCDAQNPRRQTAFE